MHKLRNAPIYPPGGQVLFFFKFQRTPPSFERLYLLQKWPLNGIDEKNQGYF